MGSVCRSIYPAHKARSQAKISATAAQKKNGCAHLGGGKMQRRILKSIVAGFAALLALCGASSAQEYPTRPIRVIVGLAPGGGGDIFARTMSEELRKALGVPVVVENRPGG